MSLDELRALEQAAGEPLVEPFFEHGAGWWKFGMLENDELALARAVVVAWNALPGLLGRVAAAEAERDEFQHGCGVLTARAESAEAERDALRTAVEREVDSIGFALAVWCPHGFDSSRSWDYGTADEIRAALDRLRAILAASASGVAEPTTKETR